MHTFHIARHQALRSLSVAVLTLGLALAPAAWAAARVDVPGMAHPEQVLQLNGTGFRHGETIEIYFDTQAAPSVVADSLGQISSYGYAVPASALPGTHWLTFWGTQSGRLVQQALTVRTNWASYQSGSNRNRSNPHENLLGVDNVGTLAPLWVANIGGGTVSSPAIVNGTVYVGANDGHVYALDASTGAVRWKYKTGKAVNASPTVAKGVVYIGSDDDQLYALDAKTGALRWSRPVDFGFLCSPTVVGDVVYVAEYGTSMLRALDATTGAGLWSSSMGPGNYVDSIPVVANGLVYINAQDASLMAFTATDGILYWKARTKDVSVGAPALDEGRLYVTDVAGTLQAVNAKTGRRTWSSSVAPELFVNSPAVGNGQVYVGGTDGTVYAFNAANGAQAWATHTGDGFHFSSPAFANGVVYIGSSQGRVLAYDATTGVMLWTWQTGGGIVSSPAVADGVVYVASRDGNLYAFAPNGSRELAKRQARAAPSLKALRALD